MSQVSPEQLARLQDEAANIVGMMSHAGWGVVVSEAEERMSNLTRALVAENNIEKIRDLQANIRSLQFLLNFPLQLVEVARRATDEAPREDA